MATKKKKHSGGRPALGDEKRSHRVFGTLTDEEHARFLAEAKELGIPPFLYARWLLTRRPIPGLKS
jgi:hypothetical protein